MKGRVAGSVHRGRVQIRIRLIQTATGIIRTELPINKLILPECCNYGRHKFFRNIDQSDGKYLQHPALVETRLVPCQSRQRQLHPLSGLGVVSESFTKTARENGLTNRLLYGIQI